MVKSVFAVSLVISLSVDTCLAAYPERPIRFIVAAVVGSAPDITSRLTTVEMTTLLGQQFVVDNRGGAGGTLGMGLLPAYRGRGIGGRLMGEAIAASRAFGFHRVQLVVFEHNARAQAFYAKFGFVSEGRRRHAVRIDGVYLDDIAMALIFE